MLCVHAHPDDEASKGASTVATEVGVTGWSDARDEALRAHAAQVGPSSPFCFGPSTARAGSPRNVDEYHLAVNLTSSSPPEDDLFAGVRERVRT